MRRMLGSLCVNVADGMFVSLFQLVTLRRPSRGTLTSFVVSRRRRNSRVVAAFLPPRRGQDKALSFPSVGPNEVDIGCRRYWGEIICLSWGQGTSDSGGAEVRERVSDARCLGRRKDAAAGLREAEGQSKWYHSLRGRLRRSQTSL